MWEKSYHIQSLNLEHVLIISLNRIPIKYINDYPKVKTKSYKSSTVLLVRSKEILGYFKIRKILSAIFIIKIFYMK